MGTTVQDLLPLQIYRENAQVLTTAGLDNEVKYFTVMEAPDFHVDSLSSHVFILTTLSAHHGSLEEINHVIGELCRVGVSAIGIKLGRFIDRVDPSTAAIAEEHAVPLITFGSNMMFREILAESLAYISDNQRQIIDQINALNHELFDAILQNRSLKELIERLCDKVECYGCCMDVEGNRIAEASSLQGELDVDAVREAIAYFFDHWDPRTGQNYLQNGNIVVFPCRAQQELLGVLCIALASNRTELAIPLAEVIVNALSVKFLEHDLKMQAKREMVSSVLDDVLFAKYKEENEIIERLTLLNFTPQKNYLLITIKVDEPDAAKRSISPTVDILQRVFEQRFDSSIAFVRGNRYVVLLGYKGDKSPAAIRKTMNYCADAVQQAVRRNVDVGCSIPTSDLRELPECYTQAKNAIKYGRSIDPNGRVFLYDDYFEMGLIAHGLNTNASATFFNRIIDPILEYDSKYKSELWTTLECCFTHGTLEKVSAELFIHISTLRYRLQKIQVLTNYNYFDIKGRMSLYLAYLLYKVSQEQ